MSTSDYSEATTKQETAVPAFPSFTTTEPTSVGSPQEQTVNGFTPTFDVTDIFRGWGYFQRRDWRYSRGSRWRGRRPWFISRILLLQKQNFIKEG